MKIRSHVAKSNRDIVVAVDSCGFQSRSKVRRLEATATEKDRKFSQSNILSRISLGSVLVLLCFSISRLGAQEKAPNQAAPSETLGLVATAAFGKTEFFQSVSGAYRQGVKEPKGILLIATTPDRVDGFFKDKKWSRFCGQSSWSLAVVGIEEKKEYPTRSEVDKAREWIARELFLWLDSDKNAPVGTERKALPIYPILLKGASDWILPVALDRDDRFPAWVAQGINRLPDIPKITKDQQPEFTTPGLLMAASKSENQKHWEYMSLLRRSDPRLRVAFFPFQGSGRDAVYQEEFARRYLAGVITSQVEDQSRWICYTDDAPLTQADLEKPDPYNLARFMWLPNEETVGAWKTLCELRPSEPEYLVPMRSRCFEKVPPSFEKLEFHHNQIAKEPKAIFLVAVDSSRPQSVFQDEKWVKFVKEQQWSLMVINLKNGQARSHSQATDWLEKELFNYLEKGPFKNFKSIPLVVWSDGAPGYWMQRIIQKRPERFPVWCMEGSTVFTPIYPGQRIAPGLIISKIPEMHFQNLFYLQDIRKAHQSNRVCFIARDQGKMNDAYLDEFTRQFLRGVASRENGLWLRFKDGKRLTLSESKQGIDPADYVWFPNEAITGAWDLLCRSRPQIPLPTITKSVVPTRMAEIPELNLFVRIPGSLNKAKKLEVKGVLCFCTWQKEDTSLINRLKKPDDPLIAFADRNQLAVITWNTAGLLPPGANIQSLSEDEVSALSKKFDQIGEVWLKGIEKVCRDHKIPDQNFLLHGVSRGSTYASRLALRYPEKFLAVHTHIASDYEAPTKKGEKVLWLVTTGEIDGGYGATRKFYEEGLKLDYPILFKAGPSLGHAMRDDIEALSLQFFEMALSYQKRVIKLQTETKGGDAAKITEAQLFRDELAKAAFFGDFINHEVYRITEGDWIPESQRIPLPGEKLAKAWGYQIVDENL